MTDLDATGIVLTVLLVGIMIYVTIIDPVRRILARRARARGKLYDPELIGSPPPRPDYSGVDQSGAPGCLLMIAIFVSFFIFEGLLKWVVLGVLSIMLCLFFIAIAGGPDERS